MESIFKLGIILSVVDKVSGPAGRMAQSMGFLRKEANSLGPVFDKFKTYGLRVGTAGALMLSMLFGTAQATVGTQKALGELASVGVTDMVALERAGRDFSNQWAGTTTAEFVSAAYDIKSGISSLTDAGVAEFTKLAALTGKATKSTTAEMTSLFATGYGIYKDFYANLSDTQFGELFSAGIAASVKQFKTTGGGMAQAISTLGAAATTAKVPLEEQLAVLGMLQASMSGSEAGTKYRAVMQSAAIASQKLGLSFMDANNQLLGLPEILAVLRSRFGETLDAVEKVELQKAFGTQEAVAVIDLLYGKVGQLSDSIGGLSAAMRNGTLTTEQMAVAMNRDIGAGMALLAQRSQGLKETIGKALIPVLVPLFTVIGNLIVALQGFAEKHKTLTRIVVIGLAALAGLAFVLGTVAAAVGAVGLLWPNVVSGLGLLTKGLASLKAGILTALPAIWSFTAALLANPITWVVIGIAALVAGLVWLYRRFEAVKRVLNPYLFALGYLVGVYAKVAKAIWGFMLLPLRLVVRAFTKVTGFLKGIDLFETGAAILRTLVAGIGSMIEQPAALVKSGFEKIRNLLPFSDAKEGPLSSLTLSGTRILETLGAGIQAAAPGLKRTLSAALGTVAVAATVAAGPQTAGIGPEKSAQAQAALTQGAGGGKRISVHIEHVELPGVSDARSFVDELTRLVEGYDG